MKNLIALSTILTITLITFSCSSSQPQIITDQRNYREKYENCKSRYTQCYDLLKKCAISNEIDIDNYNKLQEDLINQQKQHRKETIRLATGTGIIGVIIGVLIMILL